MGIPDLSNAVAKSLRDGVDDRRFWFHECHLREWNMVSFRGGQKAFAKGDNGKPLDGLSEWTWAEHRQRDAFEKLIGESCDWLQFRRPRELLEKLAKEKKQFLDNRATVELPPSFDPYPYRWMGNDDLFHGVSRIELTDRKPWLLPALLWNAADLVSHDADEMQSVFLFEHVEEEPAKYNQRVRSQRRLAAVSFIEPDQQTYRLKVGWLTQPSPIDVNDPKWNKPKAKYWIRTVDNDFVHTVRDVVLLKANSDMGLTHLVRVLYQYGTLPFDHFAKDKVTWRRRRFDAEQQKQLDSYKQLLQAGEDHNGKDRIEREYAALAQRLLANATDVATCDVRFSVIAEEVIKQALLRYKYWLDEPFRCYGHQRLNAARKKNALPDEDKPDEEMEYWSENHYIMFASAEFLIGQLWQDDVFQPGRDFLDKTDKAQRDLGLLKGSDRMARGKARVLKWLNNRLTFGWTEWLSAGYYKEHFEPLCNLADFALDYEVRTKALMVMDLFFYDIARFTHKGAMGGPGARQQFKAKRSGWDQSVGDLIELAFGARGAFVDRHAECGAIFATSSYTPPDVLLEIGTNPPTDPYVDRSRVSITFDEAPKFGIGYSQTSRQRRSLEQGYQERLDRWSPHIASVNKAITHTHTSYGKEDDDVVFWWSISAYFTKQIIDGTIATADKYGLRGMPVFSAIEQLFGDPWAPVDNVVFAGVGAQLGTFVGGAAFGLQGAAVGGLAGTAGGFYLGGKSLSLRSASAWSKVALYGLSAALGPIGIVLAIIKLGNPFSSEQHADDISVIVEGSVRTRANIYTYRCRDVMMSSVQNFRRGQLNYQSNMNVATLSGEVSTFTTAPFSGIEIPTMFAGLGGGLLLGPVGAGLAVGLNALLAPEDLAGIVDHDDGPGWWTGYWALPMVVQHGSAAIVLYDFHWMQRQLTDAATHLFLPESGFDAIEDNLEPNDDRLDDTDNPVEDVAEVFSDAIFGKNGVWLLGRLTHQKKDKEHPEPEEAYIAVFSNERLKTLDKASDFYEKRIKEKKEGDLKKLNDSIDDKRDALEDDDSIGDDGLQKIDERVRTLVANSSDEGIVKTILRASTDPLFQSHIDPILELAGEYWKKQEHQKTWESGLLHDYFAGRDRYATGKNICIIQVGSRAEFGSYEAFKSRVLDAKIELDTGDMECVYEIPHAVGSTRLKANHEDAEAWVDGSGGGLDRYPRFENPKFVRGGVVEWLQRDYTFEYQGKSLTHSLLHYLCPERIEDDPAVDADRDRIRALAVYIRTEKTSMDIFSVARATVTLNGQAIVSDEVLTVGEVDEDTDHDVEWLYLKSKQLLMPDLTIDVTHPTISRTGDRPHWRMSFQVKALLGDNTLIDCSLQLERASIAEATDDKDLAFDYGSAKVYRNRMQLNFEDWRRSSGEIPFSVKTDRWRAWKKLLDLPARSVAIARQPPGRYIPHVHVALVGDDGVVQLQKLTHVASAVTTWVTLDPTKKFPVNAQVVLAELAPDFLCALVSDGSSLFAIWKNSDEEWPNKQWQPFAVVVQSASGAGSPQTIAVAADRVIDIELSDVLLTGALNLTFVGADGLVYEGTWTPGSTAEWRRLEVDASLAPSPSMRAVRVGQATFILDGARTLWRVTSTTLFGQLKVSESTNLGPSGAFVVAAGSRLAAVEVDSVLTKVFLLSEKGEVWCGSVFPATLPAEWERVGTAIDFHADPSSPMRVAVSDFHKVHVAVRDATGQVFVNVWTPKAKWEAGHQWALITDKPEPRATVSDHLWMLSRVPGTLEVLAETEDHELWWCWWS